MRDIVGFLGGIFLYVGLGLCFRYLRDLQSERQQSSPKALVDHAFLVHGRTVLTAAVPIKFEAERLIGRQALGQTGLFLDERAYRPALFLDNASPTRLQPIIGFVERGAEPDFRLARPYDPFGILLLEIRDHIRPDCLDKALVLALPTREDIKAAAQIVECRNEGMGHQFVLRQVTKVPIGITRHARRHFSEDRLERRQDLGGGLVARLAAGRLEGRVPLAQKLFKAHAADFGTVDGSRLVAPHDGADLGFVLGRTRRDAGLDDWRVRRRGGRRLRNIRTSDVDGRHRCRDGQHCHDQRKGWMRTAHSSDPRCQKDALLGAGGH